MRLDNESALEIFSQLVKTASMDPKSPRGTKPGIGLAEIATALSYADDGIGSDMVLAIATQDYRKNDSIRAWLEQHVYEEAKRRGWKVNDAAAFDGAQKAFIDVMAGAPQPNGASPYYRWARSEFYGRAVNIAIVACRRLFREAA